LNCHLAAVNVAVAKYEYGDPRFAGFVDNLDKINAIADESNGFVWRYITDDDDAAVKKLFANDALLFNMSVWESLEDLRNFTYQSDHVHILRQRADWFEPIDGPSMVIWRQPAGEIPSFVEAKHRLECLRQMGSTEDAFTFRSAVDALDR
jgi:hypothetical protein